MFIGKRDLNLTICSIWQELKDSKSPVRWKSYRRYSKVTVLLITESRIIVLLFFFQTFKMPILRFMAKKRHLEWDTLTSVAIQGYFTMVLP